MPHHNLPEKLQMGKNILPWKQTGSPETAPSDPVLANILHISGLRQELVDLVADVKLLMMLEVTPGQFLLHAGKNLKRASVLCFAGLSGNGLLGIEDATTLKNRGSAVTGEVAGLHTVLEVDAFDDRLAAFGCERDSVRGFLRTETPID